MLRTGEISVDDVPVPALGDRFVLVRNVRSVISAGTEKTKIDMGRKSLLGKAAARPDLVKQVIRKLQREGLAKTLQTVRARLDAPSPLGYSSAGIVVAVGGDVPGIQVGDRVACGGAGYANHAELVAVPRNLVARIPDGVSFDEAAFATLGAIALQGVRLLEPRLGETYLVLGLGLLGQVGVQLLLANGCRVIGTDLNPDLCRRAEALGAIARSSLDDVRQACLGATAGRGVDGVLICAGTASNQPIELSGEITRERGRVVVVGAVGMDIPREPFFKKEIGVVISRSYGPGRYDPFYEEQGNDYPYGYVRFTEQRNMATFLDLLQCRRIDVAGLVTHRFPLEESPAAYRLLEGERREPYLGILLEYAPDSGAGGESRIGVRPAAVGGDALRIAAYGAGNYATATLLPAVAKLPGVRLGGIATASGRSAKGVAEQFGFEYCASGLDELVGGDTDAVMIMTRHDSHASSVIAALRAGRHVYVEKPLALDAEQLSLVVEALRAKPDRQLMVGFNRRFAPLTLRLQEHFAGISTPPLVQIRVNAGAIPADHWVHDARQGGGRLIGEGCHFVDLAAALCGSRPVEVHAIATHRADRTPLNNDNCVISLRFANGAAASIAYCADGSAGMPKERVEMFGGGRSAVLDDFRRAELYAANGDRREVTLPRQDKGQAAMLAAWVAGLRSGEPCVPIEDLLASSLATIRAAESLTVGMPLGVDAP
jgi:polar amino acid transport system substrate-binding protein